jgi:alanine racemase
MTIDFEPAGATGVVEIDLDALAANWRALADLVTPAACGAVVKANAYGLGADRVVPVLAAAGCRTFFVATPDEALAAHRLAPGCEVFLLDGLLPGSAAAIATQPAIPVLSSLPEVHEWAAAADARGAPLACALHVDTGLNRLGLAAAEVQKLASDMHTLARLDVRLVMSHLACADDPASPKNAQQREVFDRLRPLLPRARASLAASDGLMLGSAYHYDLVRPGYALYGGQAFQGGATPVRPVLRVTTRVLQVRDVAPGSSIGYAATYRPARAARIAVIAAGYADGLGRGASASNEAAGGQVAIHGRRAPIVGRVSMDLVTVDVTDIERERPVARGDEVELVGPHVPLELAGQGMGTIGYEVLTRLATRFARVYRGGER